MKEESNSLESIVNRLEDYATTSIELLKLKAVEKVSETSSILLSRVIAILFVLLFLISLNLGVSFWLGDVLGKTYYGFLVVAGFNAFVAIVLFLLHPTLKSRFKDIVISKLLN